jgi:hypothetical protein
LEDKMTKLRKYPATLDELKTMMEKVGRPYIVVNKNFYEEFCFNFKGSEMEPIECLKLACKAEQRDPAQFDEWDWTLDGEYLFGYGPTLKQ